MSVEKVDTLVVGAGQAGVAMSEHLGKQGISHLVLERSRIAESWRTGRWDSLVANGPAWHDRFPGMTFAGLEPEDFAHHDQVAQYFVDYADQISAPIRCGVDVISVEPRADGAGFVAQTSTGTIEAQHVVVATGPFQRPSFPALVSADTGIHQLHSQTYRNPGQLPDGAVLVVGAGSSGVQIADELMTSGKRVYLSVGPHDRPPRRYRGHDFCWWLGALGIWDKKTPAPGTEHVTIAVSGANGGHTVDFRALAHRGMTLLGRTEGFADGALQFADDLATNIALGDANYLALLDQADAYATSEGLDLPEEPEARTMLADPDCVTNPLRTLDLAAAGITSVIWATGYTSDYSWIKADAFDDKGRPLHDRGVSTVPGLYFLGLPWLSRRGSAFIWGVWHDASHLAEQIAAR